MQKDNKLILEQYKTIGEYWDENSLADHWDETEEAEFEISPSARDRYFVSIDPPLLGRVRSIAKNRGLSTESLINLFLEQQLQMLEA